MQNSLLDLQNRYPSLSEAGDPLERRNAVIDREIIRPILDRIESTQCKSAAGRKPLDRIELLIRTQVFSFDRASASSARVIA